jgi:hypothetical protein
MIAVAIVFVAFGIPVICITIIILAKMFLRPGNPDGHPKNGYGSKAATNEETRLIQEIHQSLSKLETRIGSLETIVLQNERTTK